MIVILEGPEKTGKSTLAQGLGAYINFSTLEGNEEKTTNEIVKQNGRDPENGFGYLEKFMEGIQKREIQIWDRGWVSETAYGALLPGDRLFSEKPHLQKWFYSRPLIGRGLEVILLPDDIKTLGELRDETDLDVPFVSEDKWFCEYSMQNQFSLVLKNKYDGLSLVDNCQEISMAILNEGYEYIVAGITPQMYTGPCDPIATFVGTVEPEFPVADFPFANSWSSEYFNFFKPDAWSNYGFTTPDQLQHLPSQLKQNLIWLEDENLTVAPEVTIPRTDKFPTQQSLLNFDRKVRQALEFIGVTEIVHIEEDENE